MKYQVTGLLLFISFFTCSAQETVSELSQHLWARGDGLKQRLWTVVVGELVFLKGKTKL